MIEYLPFAIAVLSLVGSSVTFILTARQREARRALDEASAAREIGESYAKLIVTLQGHINELEEEIKSERQERESQVGALISRLEEEQQRRTRLEEEIKIERAARVRAEETVRQLASRVTSLERENMDLVAENKKLKTP